MENYIELLQKSPLFYDFDEADIKKLCSCLTAREKIAAKDTFVIRAGDEVRYVYLILSGSMYIYDEDYWGNRSIIEKMGEYTLFGEAYALASREKHLVSVAAAEDSVVLEIDPEKLFKTCTKRCECHGSLIKNVADILSEKIIRMTEKLGFISQRTMREKILSYLSHFAVRQRSGSFDIPYSRQQLADYLCVDRSALSHELSRLQKAGVIRYNKNRFELLKRE